MHDHGVFAVVSAEDQNRLVAVAPEQFEKLRLGDAREHGRVRDLVPIEVEDRKHRTVGVRVEELIEMPAGGERTRLGFTVTDHAGHDQVRIVERGAESMHERVAQFATFVD